jgi:hypothetical protein
VAAGRSRGLRIRRHAQSRGRRVDGVGAGGQRRRQLDKLDARHESARQRAAADRAGARSIGGPGGPGARGSRKPIALEWRDRCLCNTDADVERKRRRHFLWRVHRNFAISIVPGCDGYRQQLFARAAHCGNFLLLERYGDQCGRIHSFAGLVADYRCNTILCLSAGCTCHTGARTSDICRAGCSRGSVALCRCNRRVSDSHSDLGRKRRGHNVRRLLRHIAVAAHDRYNCRDQLCAGDTDSGNCLLLERCGN